MSIQFKIDLNGFDDVAKKMQALDQAMQQNVQDALNQFAQQVAVRAQSLAPVKSGRLMQSIQAQTVRDWTVKVSCTAPYAAFIEFGTRYARPHYFLTRALAENASTFPSAFFEAIQQATLEAAQE